jgi:hypothetical protein
MTVVLLDAEHPGQADQALVVGEDPDDVGAPADLLVEAFQRVCGTQLGSVLGGQRVEGQQVFLGAGHTAVAAGLAPHTTLHERSPVGEARELPWPRVDVEVLVPVIASSVKRIVDALPRGALGLLKQDSHVPALVDRHFPAELRGDGG